MRGLRAAFRLRLLRHSSSQRQTSLQHCRSNAKYLRMPIALEAARTGLENGPQLYVKFQEPFRHWNLRSIYNDQRIL